MLEGDLDTVRVLVPDADGDTDGVVESVDVDESVDVMEDVNDLDSEAEEENEAAKGKD